MIFVSLEGTTALPFTTTLTFRVSFLLSPLIASNNDTPIVSEVAVSGTENTVE